ncbi:MAG: T9SS type A sorting domain-containing protein [bacterium]|nr:T9SS type A sorting domain-containing protein [bacterium]
MLVAGLVGTLLHATAAGALTEDLLLVTTGTSNGDRLGAAVARVGDLDGDGQSDVAVGIPGEDAAGTDRGRVLIHFGGPDVSAIPDLVLDGQADGEWFGHAVQAAGDFNDDGYDDLVVGAPYNDFAGEEAGRAYVFYGGPGLDAVPDVVLTGEAAGDHFGWSVAGAGDVNGDGDDLVVGAPYNAEVGAVAGRGYVFFGGASRDSVPDVILAGEFLTAFGWSVAGTGDLDGDGRSEILVGAILGTDAYLFTGAADFDSIPDLVLTGETIADRFGYSVTGLGDFDGDGANDFAIGAMHNSTGATYAGAAYVYRGGAALDSIPDLRLVGDIEYEVLGRTVAPAGDLDGDGRVDLVVGAPTPDTGGFGPGRVFVCLGRELDGSWPYDATPDLVLVGENDGDRFGAQVAPAGDLDGDGRPEFLVGADLYDEAGILSAGRCYIYRPADETPPAAVAGIHAEPGHRQVFVSWNGEPADADSVEIWRSGWVDSTGASAYPFYDDAPGSAQPVRPTDHAAAAADTAWQLVAIVPAGVGALADTVSAAGVYYYEIFARDEAGNVGPPDALGARATNYLLGDLAAPLDGEIAGPDASEFAACFGAAVGDSSFVAGADIGPTDTGNGHGVPQTDGVIDFEDAMILALDYGAAGSLPMAVYGSIDGTVLSWGPVGDDEWVLGVAEPCPDLKGVRLVLDLPGGVSATVTSSFLADVQTNPVLVGAVHGQDLDLSVVLLGAGRGFDGRGELCRVRFSEPIDPDEPVLTARDLGNADLTVTTVQVSDVPDAVPSVATLAQNYPNPFNPSTTIAFATAAPGRVRLTICDVRGRRVRALLDETRPAGSHTATWNGDDDGGRSVASGVYLCILESSEGVLTRKMVLAE